MDRKNILVAEDNDNNYLLVSIVLRNEYNVFRAVNGIEAINLIKDRSFDLIFMDIMMPLMDGIEATRKIRQFDHYTPIVALTAHRDDSNRTAALEAGCDDFLTKPVSKATILETVLANLSEE